jgi:uncharacterized protein YjiS (DUF1127 family)
MAMTTERRAPSHTSFWAAAAAEIGQAATRLQVWQERALLRRALHSLSDHELKDIGKGRADAVREGNQLFWRARINLPTGV